MSETASNEFSLDQLKPREIAEHPKVKTRFIGTLRSIHSMSEKEAEMTYEKESTYFKKAFTTVDRLSTATNISIYSTFLEIAITGLSIQGGNKSEAYIEVRGTNIGSKDSPNYVNTASLSVTAYGELNMRIKAGQIIRMNNPIVIYENDYFQPHTNERGELTIDYRPSIPRRSNTIIGCYVCIVLPNKDLDFKWLLTDDIQRLMKYAGKGDANKAGALYKSNNSQIDPGFLEAKTIKHAMRSYTKLRVGESVSFEEEIVIPAEMPTATAGSNDSYAEQEAAPRSDEVIVDINDEDTPF